MDIEFHDGQLALIETERAAQTRLPVAVIQSVRLRLRMIRAAPDLQTLENWRSLSLHQRQPESPEYLVPVSSDWTLVLRVEERGKDMNIIIKSVEEKVRGAA